MAAGCRLLCADAVTLVALALQFWLQLLFLNPVVMDQDADDHGLAVMCMARAILKVVLVAGQLG